MAVILSLAELYPGFDLNAPAIRAAIEPGIKPVCDALNAFADVQTLWSCEGHPDRTARPYVTFIAPTAFAYKLCFALSKDSSDTKLQYCWMMHALFRRDSSFQYVVEPRDYRIEKNRGFWPWKRPWRQSEMNRELKRLADLITLTGR